MRHLTALALAVSMLSATSLASAGDEPSAEANARKPDAEGGEKAVVAKGPSFAFGVGGISVPNTTSVYGGQLAYVISAPDWGKDVRIGGLVWQSEDDYTKGKGLVVFLEQNHWWNTYGLGYGSGLGTSSFEKKKSSGWDGSATQLVAYFTPVELRFGRQPAFEVSFDIGVTRFFDPPNAREGDSGVRPYAMLTAGLAL